jgi:hypothetical protein
MNDEGISAKHTSREDLGIIKSGIELISEERERQIKKEGWSALHDSQHKRDELSRAAACYALPHRFRDLLKNGRPKLWPWSRDWWKPGDYVVMEQTPLRADRIRELEKAGALIAAEIDRLNRAAGV